MMPDVGPIRVEMGIYWIEFTPRSDGDIDISWHDSLRQQPYYYRMVTQRGGAAVLAEIFTILKKCADACHPDPSVVSKLKEVEKASRYVSTAAREAHDRGEPVCANPDLAFAIGRLMGTFAKHEGEEVDGY